MAQAQQPLWRGSKAVVEQPDSPKIHEESGKTVVTRTFKGPYGKCLANLPASGASMTGFDGKVITTVDLQRQPGGIGLLTVTLEVNEDAEDVEPTYEIEWTQLEKPIESHPMFADIDPDLDLPMVQKYFEAKNYTERAEIKAYLSTAGDSGQLCLLLIDKKERGIESYLVFAPVVKSTYTSKLPAQDSTAGTREDPPTAAKAPTGFQWLRTGDTSRRTGTKGRYERTAEWTGCDEWDEDFYPTLT